MPITADDYYSIDSSGKVQYSAYPRTQVFCTMEVNKENVTLIHVQVWDDNGEVFFGEVTIPKTSTELEAYTSAESGEFSMFKDVCEQAVKEYLETIAPNTGITFTIV